MTEDDRDEYLTLPPGTTGVLGEPASYPMPLTLARLDCVCIQGPARLNRLLARGKQRSNRTQT